MPSGRRMSSACTSASPSQLSFGPGGADVAVSTARNAARVAAGPPDRSSAIRFSVSREMRNPDFSIPTRNPEGVSFAVATRCASTS